MYPRLIIDLKKLNHNGRLLCERAAKLGIPDLAFVTKGVCAYPPIIAALEDLPNPYLADSRLANLAQYPPTKKQKILLRLPMISQAGRVVDVADISFCSEPVTLDALNEAARERDKIHKVVLMVDMGDLREGIFFRDVEDILALARQAERLPNLRLFGMAFNVTCFGSVIPTQQTLDDFRALVEQVEELVGRKLDFVSCGNSSTIHLLDTADLRGFNNIRLGEGYLMGSESAYGAFLPGLYNHTMTLECEVLEVRKKPSQPIGKRGVNAFGQTVEYADRGIRLRAIVAAGQQDIDYTALTPVEPGIEIMGASSDHMILDVTDHPVKVGDVIQFRAGYVAALRAFTSPYVQKVCK